MLGQRMVEAGWGLRQERMNGVTFHFVTFHSITFHFMRAFATADSPYKQRRAQLLSISVSPFISVFITLSSFFKQSTVKFVSSPLIIFYRKLFIFTNNFFGLKPQIFVSLEAIFARGPSQIYVSVPIYTKTSLL